MERKTKAKEERSRWGWRVRAAKRAYGLEELELKPASGANWAERDAGGAEYSGLGDHATNRLDQRPRAASPPPAPPRFPAKATAASVFHPTQPHVPCSARKCAFPSPPLVAELVLVPRHLNCAIEGSIRRNGGCRAPAPGGALVVVPP